MAGKKSTPYITNIIKGAMAREGLTAKDISAATGIPYATLMQQRFPHPGSWRLYEFGALKRHLSFMPEEMHEITEALEGLTL